MKIYDKNNEEILDIEVADDSYSYMAIMGENSLTLKFSLPEYFEVPLGAKCVFNNRTYILFSPSNVKKDGSRMFGYTMIMQSEYALLNSFRIRNTIPGDRRLKFPYTAQPREFLQLLIDNLNERDSGWSFGSDHVVSTEKVVVFNHNSCAEALQKIADAFETEWEIIDKVIYLKRVEHNLDNPLPLSYGKGNGFVPGLGRSEYSDSKPLEVLFIQGGSRNIDASKYRKVSGSIDPNEIGSPELLLPRNIIWRYDGKKFEGEAGFDPLKAHHYKTDEFGYSVRRIDKEEYTNVEGSLDLSNIYPMREGIIERVETVNADKNFYDFYDADAGIPDYSKYIIPGETMTVVFQNGMLTGKEFDVNYKHPGHFEIVPQAIDGINMPGGVFLPKAGETYGIFNVMLPDEYIDDAEMRMLREAIKYLYDNEQQMFTFKGTLDGIWSKKDWVNIGGRIKLGSYIRFSDPQLEKDGVDIRITGIKNYVNNPYSPVLELSNKPITGSWAQTINRKIESEEATTEIGDRNVIQFAKRGFRDAKETMELLTDSLLNFSEGINPIWVRTMQLLVGDESLQYEYSGMVAEFRFNIETMHFEAPSGRITHRTLGVDQISGKYPDNYPYFWDMPSFESGELVKTQAYYLYAVVPNQPNGGNGNFRLEPKALPFEGQGVYNLLVGILNSEFEEDRSFAPMYGFTEILPGRITTDRVISNNGQNFLDFAANAFRVGNASKTSYLDWNTQGDDVLRLKGTIVQSPSGAEDVIGVFLGAWRAGYHIYYVGDEVKHNKVTYRCIKEHTPAGNIVEPGVSAGWESFWRILAEKGQDGHDGPWTSFVYKGQQTKPATPTGTAPVPDGWFERPPAQMDVNLSLNYSGDNWTTVLEQVGSEYFSYKKSIAIGNNGITKHRVSFTTNSDNCRLGFELKAYSEINADFMLIGFLDNDQLTRTSNYHDRISGNGVSKTVEIVVPTAGTHFIEFAYAKDSSSASYGDYGLFRFVNAVGQSTVWMSQARVTQDAQGNWLAGEWSEPIQFSAHNGAAGSSPAAVYQGDYDSGKTYYGTPQRVDIVKYNSIYYVARTDGGIFSGKTPTNSSYWKTFGAQFESIATGLLLAQYANIAEFIFKDEQLISQSGTINGVASTDYSNPNFVPNIVLNGKNGTATIMGKFTTGGTGERIELDPVNKRIAVYNPSGDIVGWWSFSDNEYGSGITLNSGRSDQSGTWANLSYDQGLTFGLNGRPGPATQYGNRYMSLGTSFNLDATAGGVKIKTSGFPTNATGIESGEWYADAADGYRIKLKP